RRVDRGLAGVGAAAEEARVLLVGVGRGAETAWAQSGARLELVAVVADVFLSDRRHTLPGAVVRRHVGSCLGALVMDGGDGGTDRKGLDGRRLRADAAVERGAMDRADGLLVAHLRVAHVAVEERHGSVRGVDDLLRRADLRPGVVGVLREPLLQELLDGSEGAVADLLENVAD